MSTLIPKEIQEYKKREETNNLMDKFASAALCGLLSRPNINLKDMHNIARRAFRIAEIMIHERPY